MIVIRWNVSGHSGHETENYGDEFYEKAKSRYDELVNHLRCHDIEMVLSHGGNDSDDFVELEHHR